MLLGRSLRWPGPATILCVVALVVTQPLAASAQNLPPQSPALPQPGDLALGEGVGSVLIGLSVRPAQPGPNTVLIYVLPVEGAVLAADVPVTLSIDGNAVPLEFCSRTCRAANVSLWGGEHLDLTADTSSGGTVGFDVPSLPPADGEALFEQMQDRMHRLRTFRSDETLRPATTPLETLYAFQAPDRMQTDLSNGSHSIFVGPLRYTRKDTDDTGWRAESIGVSLTVPAFVWDPGSTDAGPVAVHIVRSDNVDGFDTQVLAFFEQLGNYPFWFRLWVDADGLVRKAEMRGQGHFMNEHYTDFDAPLSIEPPT